MGKSSGRGRGVNLADAGFLESVFPRYGNFILRFPRYGKIISTVWKKWRRRGWCGREFSMVWKIIHGMEKFGGEEKGLQGAERGRMGGWMERLNRLRLRGASRVSARGMERHNPCIMWRRVEISDRSLTVAAEFRWRRRIRNGSRIRRRSGGGGSRCRGLLLCGMRCR